MTPLRYLSVCSGIEAASVAWEPLGGFTPAAFAQFDPEHDYTRGPDFPSRVLAHRFPHVPNLGDMTRHNEWTLDDVSLLVGGTPCQSFSVAGLRAGMADPRGNLALTYLAIADRLSPRWLLWENVPGVLSADGGQAFASVVDGMVELGYGVAWRVLDAQFFGVPQRRRRVFVVGYRGDWRPSAAVLFERESLRRYSETGQRPRRRDGGRIADLFGSDGAGGDVAHTLRRSHDASEDGSGRGVPLVPAIARALNTKGAQQDASVETFVTFRAGGDPLPQADRIAGASDVLPAIGAAQGSRVPVALNMRGRDGGAQMEAADLASLRASSGGASRSFIADTLTGGARKSGGYSADDVPLIGLSTNDNGHDVGADIAPTLRKNGDAGVANAYGVRRLTPRECERLQGFPDDWTLVPVGKRGRMAADAPRYAALGNSMAVPVMQWLGARIIMVDGLLAECAA